MLFADLNLARRLEAAEAAATGDCARSMSADDPAAACVREIAGGWALRVAPASPLNKATGLGLHGSVSAADLDGVEEVLGAGGGRVVIDLCPLADQTLIDLLAARRYTVAEVENVLVAEIGAYREPPDEHGRSVEIRQAGPDEADTWGRTLARGFADDGPISEDMVRMGAAMFGVEACRAYLGLIGGRIVGASGMGVHRGVAPLYGTAVLPEFRRRGVQTAFLRRRLADARAAGCDLAKIATRPGTTSQRNAERHGFRVVYTKAQMVRPGAG